MGWRDEIAALHDRADRLIKQLKAEGYDDLDIGCILESANHKIHGED